MRTIGIGDQFLVVSTEEAAMFVHRRTGSLYFYKAEVCRFVNAYGEAELSYCTQENPQQMSEVNPPSLMVDVAAYPSTAPERVWFLRPEATQPMPTGPATLALLFDYAHDHYPVKLNASFASAMQSLGSCEWRR